MQLRKHPSYKYLAPLSSQDRVQLRSHQIIIVMTLTDKQYVLRCFERLLAGETLARFEITRVRRILSDG